MKQLKPLTEQQRTQLVIELFNLGEPYERLRQRANSVKLKDTYGTIELRHWVDDLVCLKGEAYRMAEEIIRRRREQLEREGVPMAELEKMGLYDAMGVLSRRAEAERERLMRQKLEELEKRLKKAEAFVRTASPRVRFQVKELLEARGSPVKSDEHWELTLHTYVADQLEAVEAFIRRLPK